MHPCCSPTDRVTCYPLSLPDAVPQTTHLNQRRHPPRESVSQTSSSGRQLHCRKNLCLECLLMDSASYKHECWESRRGYINTYGDKLHWSSDINVSECVKFCSARCITTTYCNSLEAVASLIRQGLEKSGASAVDIDARPFAFPQFTKFSACEC